MSKTCPNCFFKNEHDDNFCQECGNALDIEQYIESKKWDKNFSDKVKSFFGSKRIDGINKDIEDFIYFSQEFIDYDEDLSNLRVFKLDVDEFKDKYSKISKLDEFNYLDEINKDKDLNKKILYLKSIKTFINNFDEELDNLNKLLDDINQKSKGIDEFNKDLNKLLDSDSILEINDKNSLIQSHKATYDFFDRDKVKKLNIDLKSKIQNFINDYKNITNSFNKHNEEIKTKKRNEIVLNYHEKSESLNDKINNLKESEDFISSSTVVELKEEFKDCYDFFKDDECSDFDSSIQIDIKDFLNNYDELENIVDKINEELTIKILQDKVNSKIDEIYQFKEELDNLLNSDFYITYKQQDEIIKKYVDLYDLIFDAEKKIELSDECNEFYKNYPKINSIIKKRNKEYVDNELNLNKEFFDDIDGKSLDKKQRLAVVINEQNSQIIAGAGCGKTLTVNAKVRYLIEKKGVNPSEILCLSFSNLSVGDLKDKLPDGVEISTFHKLGGSILKDNDKPSRPDTDAMENFVKDYFKNHVIHNEKLCHDLFEFYSYYLYSSIDENQATSLGEVFDIEEGKDFKTLKQLYGGDNKKITYDNKIVKSLEELIISNYLFAHQIDYEYEKVFEWENKYYLTQKESLYNLIFDDIAQYPMLMDDLLGNLTNLCEIKKTIKLKNYSPDFYLTQDNIYLEHFGVNKNCEALWLDKEDSDKYREGINWKRQLHKNYGSNLLETFSYYMSEDRLLKRLEEKLKQAGVEVKEINLKYLIGKIVERDNVNRFSNFIKLIITFIQLFKGNDYTIDKFDEFRLQNKNNEDKFDKKRTDLFLNIAEDIYIAYENHLKDIEKIDFNDMINNATKEVKKGNLHKNYRYIIVDEYQDTSYTRYNLVKAIQDKTNAKVCVVGDDWQSIYRFTGCDVALFSKFENYFENPEKLRIETTYRNCQELIDISGRFIKKNPNQINKSLKSKKKSTDKPVKLCYYNKSSTEDKIKTMEFLINEISKKSNDIMILGRNNFDINDYVEGGLFKRVHKDNPELIYTNNKDLNIKFISVHKSKGLEEDNVIIINLENKSIGFPNQMIDDPLMNFVINDSDQFPHGEERRLFYVALTRTKNNTYLLVPDTDKSEFVLELEENINDLEILSKDSSDEENYDDMDTFMENKNVYSIKTHLKCPICKTGDILLKIVKSKKGNEIFKFFECSHRRCEWEGGSYYSDLDLLDEIEICPTCGKIRYVVDGKYGPFMSCQSRCKAPKLKGKKLKRINKILNKFDEDIDYQYVKSNVKCSKCGEGYVTLKINPENNKKQFVCSSDSCDFDGEFTNIDKSKLKDIKICPECGGILVLRNGKYGKFYSCNNSECKYTKNMNKAKTEKFEEIKTDFRCPECDLGDIIIKLNKKSNKSKVTCSLCDWDGGNFDKSGKVDSIKYCKNPECGGITYLRDGQFGEFRTCSNYFKTKCNGKSTTSKSTKKDNSSKSSEVRTILKCPSCKKGYVVLDNSKFKCSKCDWNGGTFVKSGKLDSIEHCECLGCDGITYLRDGKYGKFRTCSNYFKTKCSGNQKNKSKKSFKSKSPSKWEKIDTHLQCHSCYDGDIILLKNKETGKGFFKCTNNDCDWTGGSFNKSENLLNTLSYCPEVNCDGLTYEIEGKYGKFRVCTRFSKTGCKGGKR